MQLHSFFIAILITLEAMLQTRIWISSNIYMQVHSFFYCYSDQNSDKISVHIIQEYRWFFAISEQQKIKINFQRPLVLSLCIKPLHDNG